MEQEAQAAWKRKEEVHYNLLSKYMDQEDKWKKTLGQDLYKDKGNMLAVDPAMRQRISTQTKEDQILMEESQGITQLLFKGGKGHLHDSWKQGFFFDPGKEKVLEKVELFHQT